MNIEIEEIKQITMNENNDSETNIHNKENFDTFDDFFLGISKIIEEEPTKSIIIQSDSKEFIDFIKKSNQRGLVTL